MSQNTITLHTENGDWIAVYDGPGAADIKAAHGSRVITTAYKAKTPQPEVVAKFKAIYPAWLVRISPTQYTGCKPTPEWILEQTGLAVARMVDEIHQCWQSGQIPRTVSSFDDLHSHIDANELGGFCDDEIINPIIAAFGGRHPDHYGYPEEFMPFVDNCQQIVGQWLEERAAKAGENQNV
jgi:hypothetical protein